MSDAPAPNTTGPFIAVIFILILLPFSFGIYSLYNSFNERHLQRERNRIGILDAAAAQGLPARPVLWEAWTEPPGRSTSCDDTLDSWNSIQPLWAKPELSTMIPEIVTNKSAEVESSAALGAMAGGEAGQQLLSRASSLWWYLGLLAPLRSTSSRPRTEPQQPKPSTDTSEVDVDIWKHSGDYQLQIGVVVALPSPPMERASDGEVPGGHKEDNMEEQVDHSTVYCIGTASYPIRIDAG